MQTLLWWWGNQPGKEKEKTCRTVHTFTTGGYVSSQVFNMNSEWSIGPVANQSIMSAVRGANQICNLTANILICTKRTAENHTVSCIWRWWKTRLLRVVYFALFLDYTGPPVVKSTTRAFASAATSATTSQSSVTCTVQYRHLKLFNFILFYLAF